MNEILMANSSAKYDSRMMWGYVNLENQYQKYVHQVG